MIETNSKKELRTFVREGTFFLLPLLVLVLFPLFVFWYHGEFESEQEVIVRQMAHENILFGKAYITSGLHESFKTASLQARMPEILVLGDSRVLQFRSKFFSNVSFYNAGGLVGRLEDFSNILNSIPEAGSPKVIIVGLDHPFFHPDWEKNHYEHPKEISLVRQIIISFRSFYRSLFRGDYVLGELFPKTNDNVGLVASVRGDGVASDGSYVYGSYYRDPHNPENIDFQFRDTLERIERGERLFEPSTTIYPEAPAALDVFLKEAKRRNIHVVGFLPPYPHVVYEKIKSTPTLAYMQDIEPEIKPLFEAYGYPFYNFSDLATLGATDEETIDGFHASEKAYLRLFIQMAKSDTVLARYVDIPNLLERLMGTAGNYEVFGDEF